jgi:hypothetical protein
MFKPQGSHLIGLDEAIRLCSAVFLWALWLVCANAETKKEMQEQKNK